MIVLATSETITLTTSTGTVIVDVTYGDRSGSTFAEGNQRTSVTGTSTIVDAPNSGNRLVKNIYIKPSVTATITLTVDGAALLDKSVEGGATIDLLNDASFTLLAISQVSGLQAALDLKAPLASPALTGVPTAPTAAADTDTTQIATTAFAKAEADAAQAFAIQRANHTGTQLAATISDFASAALSATDSAYVNISGTETITGAKTFSNGLTVSSGTTALQATTVTTLTASQGVTATGSSAFVLGGTFQTTSAATSLSNFPVLLLQNTDATVGNGVAVGANIYDTGNALRRAAQISFTGSAKSASAVAGEIRLQTATAAGTLTTALTIDATQAATFAAGITCTTLATTGLTSVTTSTAMTAPASNAVHITDGKIRCGNTSGDSIQTDGGLSIKDGITAPSATSGYAKIYVDTADGDLKVIFGDGTIKTIVTDT